MDAVAED